MALMGNLKAGSPTMERLVKEREMTGAWEETEKHSQRWAHKAKETKEFFSYVIPRLDLEIYLPLPSDEPATEEFMLSENVILPTLSLLKSLGLTKEQATDLMQEWRETGHKFPDKRFDSFSVAKALAKHAESKGLVDYSVDQFTTVEEPIIEDKTESTIYAMIPEERGELAIQTAKNPADLATLEKLISWDADVNATTKQGDTALIWAATNNNIAAIQALLADPGIDVNIQNIHGVTALIWAAFGNNTDAIQQLLAAGADVNATNRHGYTALIWAASKSNTAAVEALLAAPGIDVNATNQRGETALIWSAYRNNTDAIQALLAAPGIDANATTKQGDTALILAADRGNLAVIQALLTAPSIDVNATNQRGQTALNIARVEIAELLRQHGATSGRWCTIL